MAPATVGRGGRMAWRRVAVGYGDMMVSMVGHATIGCGGMMMWRRATVGCVGRMMRRRASSVCRHAQWQQGPPRSTATCMGNVPAKRMVAEPAIRADGGMCHVSPGRPVAMESWYFFGNFIHR
jgi:hypothetical protein